MNKKTIKRSVITNKKKILSISIIFLFLIISLGVGIYLRYQNRNVQQEAGSTEWKTYSNNGYYIKYPSNYKFYENELVSVDGVVSKVEGTNEIISPTLPNLNTNFSITIMGDMNKFGTVTKVVDFNKICSEISSKTGENMLIDGKEALIFKDTTCGPYGGTYIYTADSSLFYIIKVESSVKYDLIKQYVDPLISTFKFK